jgi:hypothetical protein
MTLLDEERLEPVNEENISSVSRKLKDINAGKCLSCFLVSSNRNKENDFLLTMLYSVNETRISAMQHKTSNVICLK